MELSDITPVYKAITSTKKKTMGLRMFYLFHLKNSNVAFMIKFTKALAIY